MITWKREMMLAALVAGLAATRATMASEEPTDAVRYASYFAQEEVVSDEALERWIEELSPESVASPPPQTESELPTHDTALRCESDSACRPVCGCDQPWRLLGHGLGCGIDVRGWIDLGATVHDSNPPSKFSGPLTFNDREEFQFNQLYLAMEKAIEHCGCGWDWGGRVDLLYGYDHRFSTARGLEIHQDLSRKWNSSPFFGLAAPQMYVEAGYNNLSVKMGHFYSIVGYESVMAPDNFFYSHSYMFQYGEPKTHTGLLGSWCLSDCLSLHTGFDRGWNNWEDDTEGRLSYLGGLTWTNGCGSSLAWSGTIGEEPDVTGALSDNRILQSLVLSHELGRYLTYVVQHDYAWQNDGAGPAGDAEWYGIAQYLMCRLTSRWTAGCRAEWFRDDDGVRVTGLQPGNPIRGDHFAGNFWEVTCGSNFRPNSNVTVRHELRYDWFDGLISSASGNLPFDDGHDGKQFTVAMDVIWTY